VKDTTSVQFDDDKDENGTKEQIVNYSEVTGPDMLGVVLEESACPRSGCRWETV
jgi:hypothetical protein